MGSFLETYNDQCGYYGLKGLKWVSLLVCCTLQSPENCLSVKVYHISVVFQRLCWTSLYEIIYNAFFGIIHLQQLL